MKILKLRFKNLNSLYGEWLIDFTNPAYTQGSIFAITGPTGSGKSTILDAISLALYGKTPRLQEITKSTNEIMARQTGECFAELEFETTQGYFKCHWSQHRAHHKPGEDLQSPSHEISDKNGKLIAISQKRKDVLDKIIEVTGLDFDQFTRSILLAQGGFAAFLEAKPDERSPILEQITGTEIYSTISIRVHERTSEERVKFEELRTELGMIQILNPDDENALKGERDQKQKDALGLSNTIKIVQESIDWNKRLGTIREEIIVLNEEKEQFEQYKIEKQEDLQKLELAKKARTIEADFTKLETERETLKKNFEGFQECTGKQVILKDQYEKALKNETVAFEQLKDIRGRWEKESPIITSVRNLDVKIQEAGSFIGGIKEEHAEIVKNYEKYQKLIEDNTRNLDETTLTLQQTDEYLSENQKDSNLPEIIIALDQQFKVYRSLESKLHKVISNQKIVQKNYEKAGRDFSNQTEAFDKKKQELVNVSEKFITLLESLSLILEGQDLTYWREKESRLRDNLELVRQLKETHETFNETLKELKTLSESQKKKKRDVLKNSKNLKQFQKEAQIQEKYVEQLEGKELLVARIRDLENERKLLEDKKPCPLCGSPEHPYARGNIPIPEKITTELKGERKVLKVLQGKISQLVIENAHNDSELEQNKRDREKLNKIVLECKASWTTGCQELGFDGKIADKSNEVMKLLETYEKDFSFCHELITNANKKEKDLQKIEKIVNTCKEDLSAIELARQKADSEYKTQDAEKQRLHEEHEGISAEILEAIDILANFLDKYGYQEFDPKKFPTIIKKFTNRSKEYQNQIERKQILETEKARISSEIFAYNKSLGDSHIQLTTKNALLQDREIGLHKLTVQRISIYEDKNPDDEEIKINKILKDTQESYTRILQAKHEINLNLNSIESRLDSFKKVIDSSRETLNSLEILFKYSLEKTGFTDENKFLEACLPEETFEELRALEEGLRSREIQISTRIKDKNASLSSELEKNLTNRSPEQLSEEYIMLSSRSDELKARLGAVSEIIRKNDEIKLQQKDKLGELDAQKKECDRWERLHTLIGSSDGKKFRNFAQGLTFEILISHANQHLQKMSDRYLLIRDHLASMDLNVIDNYQAGEIRSTKNLSGGESFLVSLALALGLSSMASHKVRIDSFFLDEGFGSLDDDALDTALATLSGLQQEGKLTGIISHVAAIKDRIATQIIIEKGTGGRSRLMGPGCKLKSY